MTKTLTAIAAASALMLATFAAPQQAEARHGRVAAGIIGAAANGGYYYAPPPPYYYYAPRCYWRWERYWNGWRWRSHRVRVCY